MTQICLVGGTTTDHSPLITVFAGDTMSAARHTCAELVEAISENGSPASSRLLASKDAGVPSFLRALRVSA